MGSIFDKMGSFFNRSGSNSAVPTNPNGITAQPPGSVLEPTVTKLNNGKFQAEGVVDGVKVTVVGSSERNVKETFKTHSDRAATLAQIAGKKIELTGKDFSNLTVHGKNKHEYPKITQAQEFIEKRREKINSKIEFYKFCGTASTDGVETKGGKKKSYQDLLKLADNEKKDLLEMIELLGEQGRKTNAHAKFGDKVVFPKQDEIEGKLDKWKTRQNNLDILYEKLRTQFQNSQPSSSNSNNLPPISSKVNLGSSTITATPLQPQKISQKPSKPDSSAQGWVPLKVDDDEGEEKGFEDPPVHSPTTSSAGSSSSTSTSNTPLASSSSSTSSSSTSSNKTGSSAQPNKASSSSSSSTKTTDNVPDDVRKFLANNKGLDIDYAEGIKDWKKVPKEIIKKYYIVPAQISDDVNYADHYRIRVKNEDGSYGLMKDPKKPQSPLLIEGSQLGKNSELIKLLKETSNRPEELAKQIKNWDNVGYLNEEAEIANIDPKDRKTNYIVPCKIQRGEKQLYTVVTSEEKKIYQSQKDDNNSQPVTYTAEELAKRTFSG